MKRSNKILVIMVASAIVALGFGFWVLNSRGGSPLPAAQQSDNNPEQKNTEQNDVSNVPVQDQVVPTTGWKVYNNDKHTFSVLYPQYLKAGSISDNSVIGTFQVPIRGYHVGPLVFVVLKDAEIKKSAKELFDNVYNGAKNPPTGQTPEELAVTCRVILDRTDKKAVACEGEGGPAKYVYISGPAYDVFVDGYSKGYDSQDNGNLKDEKDLIGIVQSFSFSTRTEDTSATQTSTTPPSIKSFAITADDIFATPDQITVDKGSIIQITFTVGANTISGGLEFKSPVVNSGTINAGQSKTISFRADQSFEFTPYLPSSTTAKGYKIKVIVQDPSLTQ